MIIGLEVIKGSIYGLSCDKFNNLWLSISKEKSSKEIIPM